MSETTKRGRLLREALAPYASADAAGSYVKMSISLPNDLVEVVRAAADANGLSVSATIAAALRRTLLDAEQDRLDAALELDAEENVARARAYERTAVQMISDLEW